MQNISTIFSKEIASFLNSLIAYIVMAVFLIGVGVFCWLFEFNILENGYASLDTLFEYAPFMFLFLIPAITMRAFSEEIKTGTIELLSTKPLTDWQIILGKYLAAVFLVFLSLLPTIIYAITVYRLGEPVGNMDMGATIGAYIGLFFLGAIFASIGLFTSALTENQIVAFILGVFCCFVFFLAFDFLSGVKSLSAVNAFLIRIGILEHYQSISRGVIDTRDALYFISFVSITLILTWLVFLSRKK